MTLAAIVLAFRKKWKKVNKIKYFRNSKMDLPKVPGIQPNKKTAKVQKNRNPPRLEFQNKHFTKPLYVWYVSFFETL